MGGLSSSPGALLALCPPTHAFPFQGRGVGGVMHSPLQGAPACAEEPRWEGGFTWQGQSTRLLHPGQSQPEGMAGS